MLVPSLKSEATKMTNPQKKNSQMILEIWTELKEKILELQGNHQADQLLKESMMERYEKKLREKETLIHSYESESILKLAELRNKIIHELKLSINAPDQQIISTLQKRLRK